VIGGRRRLVVSGANVAAGSVLGGGPSRTRVPDWMMRWSHFGRTSGSQIDNAHQQDPHDHENSLMGDGVNLCAARDSNPEPAG
jgi:hypothetical protein